MLFRSLAKHSVLCLSFVAVLSSVSCERKETAPGDPAPATTPSAATPKETIDKILRDLSAGQEASAKELAAVTDAKSCAAAIGRVTESMNRWLAAVPAVESANDPDGTLATQAKNAGRAVGMNYGTALKISEPFKNDPEVGTQLKKLRAAHEELMK